MGHRTRLYRRYLPGSIVCCVVWYGVWVVCGVVCMGGVVLEGLVGVVVGWVVVWGCGAGGTRGPLGVVQEGVAWWIPVR